MFDFARSFRCLSSCFANPSTLHRLGISRRHRPGNAAASLFVAASQLFPMCLFAFPAPAGTTLTVNTTVDSNDGSCGSTCSLRDAITQANSDSGDTINFSVTGTITLSSGLPPITTSMSIQGPGASQLAVSGNNAVSMFMIASGTTVGISALTIANGNTGLTVPNVNGGGIGNWGTLAVAGCTFSGNYSAEGGAIYNAGALTVSNSTFSGNSATYGGAILTDSTLTVSNTTFSGNSAIAGKPR
jgi:CSLREA domain-containing protein